MSDNELEQADRSASKIGKFNTADDLLKAYNALESEFTKRCQLVKELQTELENLRAQATATDDKADTEAALAVGKESTTEAEPTDIPPVAESSEKPDEYNGVLDEVARNAALYAELLCVVPEVMDACIARYKERLIQTPNVGSPSGMAVIVPAKRPKTLNEAKRLADSMLK